MAGLNKPINVAIIGAGPAGLMAADVLSRTDIQVDVYEAKPSAGRKFLMAGKGGLNITHNEPLTQFINRYDQSDWLAPMVHDFNAQKIRQWMSDLGIDSFVGTSGRVFPTEMKAAPLLRHWLSELKRRGIRLHCRQYWQGFTDDGDLQFATQTIHADATILALGGGSWANLGSDGLWTDILRKKGVEIEPFQPSNCGFKVDWSSFIKALAGKPLKNIRGKVNEFNSSAELILTEYGIEGGLVYALSKPLREAYLRDGNTTLWLDLLPDSNESDLISRLQTSSKLSLANIWRKARIDDVRAALIREALPKKDWTNAALVATCLKNYPIYINGSQPIDEAISTAGGVKRDALDEQLMLKQIPSVFCCGEMLDWDAPTGGYLLTASFASGRFAARGVLDYLASLSRGNL